MTTEEKISIAFVIGLFLTIMFTISLGMNFTYKHAVLEKSQEVQCVEKN